VVDIEVDTVVDKVVDIEVDTVVDIEVDTVVDRVVDTEVDKVVDKVVDTEVDMVDTRVDRVVDMMVDIEVDKVVDTGCSNRAAAAACTDTAYGTAYSTEAAYSTACSTEVAYNTAYSTEAAYNTAYSNTAEADTVVDMVVDRGLDTACSTGVSACSRSAPAWAASHSRGWCSRGWNNSGSCSKDLYRSRCSPPPTTPPAYTEHRHQLGFYSFTSEGETFDSRGGLITRFDLDSTAVRLLIKGH